MSRRPHGAVGGLVTLVLLSASAPAHAQRGAAISRQVPPPRPSPGAPRAAIAAETPTATRLALTYASLDLVGDSNDAGAASLFASLGFKTQDPLLKRTSIAVLFDPVSSAVDGHGQRQTGVGDLGLRAGIVGWQSANARQKVIAQYTLKIPTASATKELGSGHPDQRIGLSYDRTWKYDIWSNVGFVASFNGTDEGEPVDKIASFAASVEVPVRERYAYQGAVQFNTPFTNADLSTAQQHGGAARIGATSLWLGGGFSLAHASDWNPGAYVRAEWRP